MSGTILQGASLLEQLLEVAALALLEVRVAADVLLGDEDVGHGALAAHLTQGVLDRVAVL